MGLPRFRLLPVIVGLCALPALLAHAQQPKRDFIESDIAARNLMSDCAAIWTVKNHHALVNAQETFMNNVDSNMAQYAQAKQDATQLVRKAEQELDALNDTLAVASFAEAVTMEKAQNKGLISKEQAVAVAANVAQNTARAARDAAEARLQTARNLLNGINRRMIGWTAYNAGMKECIDDQLKYLAKTNPGSIVPPAEPTLPPPANVANIQKAQGTVSGTWRATCRYSDVNNIPADGRFSMNIDAQRNIAAAFVDGTAATVKGTMQPTGQVNATGTVAMAADLVVFVTMVGQMTWASDGALRGSGRFTSSNQAVRCEGTWFGG